MKMRRFCSVFLLFTLLLSLFAIPQAAAGEDFGVVADAALLIDLGSNTPIYSKNEHKELYPASLTKIMTGLLVFEALDAGKLSLEDEITAQSSAFDTISLDGSSAGIKPGEVMTVNDLLYCMLVVSANEACTILAEAVSGSVNAFVAEMNTRAKELGCDNTHFENPHGLHNTQHYTSAWDMLLITEEAMKHEQFMEICDTAQITLPETNLHEARVLHTTNYLLSRFRAIGYVNKEAHGIKTGSTSDAGHCLVSTAQRGSRTLLSIVLGARTYKDEKGKTWIQSFTETTDLFNYGFDHFSYQTVLTPNDIIGPEIPVTLSREVNYITVHPKEDVVLLLPNDVAPEDLKQTITYTAPTPTVEAPIQEGEVLGHVTLSYNEKEYVTVPLLALNSVSASRTLVLWHNVKMFFAKPIVRIVAIAIAVILVFLFIRKLLFGSRRNHYGKTSHRHHNYRGRRR